MSDGPVVTERRRATIRDVAALAGVGTKTVSRVVNNESNVSQAMRDRVLQAVEALHFRPNFGAGSLRRSDGKTLTIGLLLDAVDNPFSAGVNRGVERVAATRDTAVFAASSDDDPERERRMIDAFTRRRVDGLILTSICVEQDHLREERNQGTPMVFVDRTPTGLTADAVVSDNCEAAHNATAHLIAGGHRRIAHLGDDLTISTAQERSRGYEEAMTAAGLTREVVHRSGLTDAETAYRAVVEVLAGPRPPTAVFSSQNEITLGALRALHALGRQHEIAVVGFDDVALADLIAPPVTVVAQDPHRIGALAAERIFARLDGDDSPATTVVVPTRLIVRGTGEIRPPANGPTSLSHR